MTTMCSLAVIATSLLVVQFLSFSTARVVMPGTICAFPKKVGPCYAAMPRYYYNKDTGTCEKFIYGGCRGNANNFLTIEGCEYTCNRGNVCYWPPDVGPGTASIERFYYDKQTGTCQTFTYGGCYGNANNFETKEACEKKCQTEVGPGGEVCALHPEVGPCHGAFKRYYYNRFTGTCEIFTYGGCQGNKNNFLTKEACENTCNRESVCYWPPETGPCFANFQHFYYDKRTGTCQIFTYGGCLGNANNFETKKACKKKCQTEVGPGGEVCALSPEVGPCHRALQRYYYNRFKGTCEPFIYGGCQGNENNFLTVEACENTCNRDDGRSIWHHHLMSFFDDQHMFT